MSDLIFRWWGLLVSKRSVKHHSYAAAEPEDQFYGDRVARVVDPSGNRWFIASHVEDVDMDELMRRIVAMGDG